MNARTLKALRGSIKKWELIVLGRKEDTGTNNCPLCAEFYFPVDQRGICGGCPVKEATGKSGCVGSPYTEWTLAVWEEPEELAGERAYDNPGYPQIVCGPRTMAAAIAEHDFLVSLLPEGK